MPRIYNIGECHIIMICQSPYSNESDTVTIICNNMICNNLDNLATLTMCDPDLVT